MSKDLFLKIYKCEREKEIDEIIQNTNMQYKENWIPYGDNISNFSVIGNQASNAERALIEKITNAVDAVLIRRCYEEKIDPKDKNAPQSPQEALSRFFNIKDGNLSNIKKDYEKELSKNILLIATNKDCEPNHRNSKYNPNLIIYDNGEGQTPNKLPSTILSLLSGNKRKINFTQGNYNQGGSGSLMYCGDKGYSLVISKRNTKIPLKYRDSQDNTYELWGWTLIRKEIRSEYKDPVYTYYAPNGKVPSFRAKYLELLPEGLNSNESKKYINYKGSCKAYKPYKKTVECGTVIKLYNYKVNKKGPLNGNIKYDLSSYIYDTYLPVKFIDCRKNKGSNSVIFRGFKRIIEDDMRINYEPQKGLVYQKINFDFKIDDQKAEVTLYCCNKRSSGDLIASKLIEGGRPIKFCLGQQFQGGLTNRFLNASGLGVIQDLIIAIVEFPNISTEFKSNLFMTDRERLYDKKPKKEIERKLKDYFKESEELKEFRNYILKDNMEDEKNNNSTVKEIIEKWIKKDPLIKNVLSGNGIFDKNLKNKSTKKEDNGEIEPKRRIKSNNKEKQLIETKQIPTYFEPLLKCNEEGTYLKPAYVEKSFRIRFETDAENSFFSRLEKKGYIRVYIDNKEVGDFSKSLNNGIATLIFDKRISGRKATKKEIYIEICYEQEILFEHTIFLNLEEINKNKESESNKDQGVIGIPNYKFVCKENWHSSMNEESAVILINDCGKDLYYINKDNKYLKDKRKQVEGNPILKDFYNEIFLYNMLFVAISTKNSELSTTQESENKKYSINEEISIATKAYARAFFITEHLNNEMRKKIR